MKQLLTDEHIECLFDTAIETGIHYWCSVSIDENIDADLYDFNEEGWELTVFDHETMIKSKMTKDSFYKGFELLAQIQPERVTSVLTMDIDAEDADVWFQLCLFGEIIYG